MLSPFDLLRVTGVRHVRAHTLWLRFSDGVAGEVDLSPMLAGGVLGALVDRSLFARVRLGPDTIEWPNGADFAPEMLHAMVTAGNRSELAAFDDGLGALSPERELMPGLSRFYGIVITMFCAGHARPHFHARLGEHAIAIEIDGDGVRGSFPPSRLPLLFEWRELHREELRANWERMRGGEAPLAIAPLT